MAINAIVKFLSAARSLVDQGMSKEAVMNFARNEFGEINELFQKQINNLFKPKQGIENIKIKDEVFDDTVIKLPVDDTGAPFNPKDPMKQYGKPKKDPPTGFQTERFIRDFPVTREEAERIAKLPNDERKIILQKYIDEDMSRQITLMDYDPPKGRKPNAEGGIAGFYTGGLVDVEPNLSDIGHGSDALMARTRLVSPNSQATTSTGLNYLLAEDNDNIRVPFSKGKLADAARRKFMKLAGSGAAGLAALKTGLLGFGKEAAPVVEKAVETVQQTPQYFFDLVAKIKMFGKQSKVGPQERMNEFSYTGKNGDEYTLVEDISTGDAQITKDKMGGVRVSEDEVTDGIVDRSVMEYKSGKGMADESTKGTLPDEYDEYKVEFDQDGTQAGADILDESVQKEIIEEISTDKFLSDKMKFKEVSEKITKKASGGIARMIGE